MMTLAQDGSNGPGLRPNSLRLAVVLLTNLNGVEHGFERTLPHGDPILAIAERYLMD